MSSHFSFECAGGSRLECAGATHNNHRNSAVRVERRQTRRTASRIGGITMDIQDMRIFARVAAVQNLSAVGTELGLTPGTISKRIQALEDELSARLFDRTTRSIRITEEGAAFLAPRRAHPLRDRGGARQRRRQGEQAQGRAQDRGAGLPRAALRGARAVRVRARLSRDRRAASTCTTGRSTCRRTATTWPSAPASWRTPR